MSIIIPVADDDSNVYKIEVSGPRALVAELKAKFTITTGKVGKLLSFFCNHVEMQDNRSVVEYYHGFGAHVSAVEVPHQPFAPVDYVKMNESLLKEGFPKNKNLPYNADTWNTTWNKGNEWERYPPVDVNNIWTSIPPSSSRELTRSSSLGESAPSASPTKGSNDYSSNDANMDTSRALLQEYICSVRGFKFSRFYRMEGKWNGEARVVDLQGPRFNAESKSEKPSSTTQGIHQVHISSSQLFYIPKSRSWGELQHVTTPDGVMTSHRMAYTPVSNHVLMVETDQQALSDCVIRVREQEDANTLVFTAVRKVTGQPIVIETITCSNDFQSRTRTTQHFDDSGNIVAVYVFTEKKILDSESGAMMPYGSPRHGASMPTSAPPPQELD